LPPEDEVSPVDPEPDCEHPTISNKPTAACASVVTRRENVGNLIVDPPWAAPKGALWIRSAISVPRALIRLGDYLDCLGTG
jgi:hypothetical protein